MLPCVFCVFFLVLTWNCVDSCPRKIKNAINFIKPVFMYHEVCYGEFGCFNNGNEFSRSWTRPITLLPRDPEVIRPRYYLYTKRNSDPGYSDPVIQEIYYQNVDSIRASNFDHGEPTKMIIHGFMDNGQMEWIEYMMVSLLRLDFYNVIVVDWSTGAKFPYSLAVANTRMVGAMIAQMIKWLEREFGARRQDFHLLGHSLGAHIAGYAGERLRQGSQQLGRISGMDPAGPYFENTDPKVRLDPTDAGFVDAIHTDAGSLFPDVFILEGGFGLMQPVGHVDFYPNGGKKQPGCSFSNNIVKVLRQKEFNIRNTFLLITACDHLRVLAIMTNTILYPRDNYWAVECKNYYEFTSARCDRCKDSNCAKMGIRANEWNPAGRVNVKMYLKTEASEPFLAYPYHPYWRKHFAYGALLNND